jgi:pimeloyl-ACP methyl ester carboxylesterase
LEALNMITTKAAWLSLLLFAATPAVAQPPAQMIENGGHKLAFHVTPGHRPVIVLDAGGGLDASYWDKLAPELARRTGCRVITYDRASMGASDIVDGPWRVEAAVSDLETGLRKLGATRDVILVSHSIAGEIATYLTQKHPGWFKGAVLVDASVPPFYTDAMVAKVAAAYAPLVEKMKTEPLTPASRQLIAVQESFFETSSAYHKATWPTRVPVTVIVAEETPFEAPEDRLAWHRAQAEFATAAPNRRLVIAEHSSHNIAIDRPDVIIDAIVAMIAKKR